MLPKLDTDRFTTETGMRIVVQVPQSQLQAVKNAVLEIDPLKHGDYDAVTFTTSCGAQSFRSLGSGRNAQTEAVVNVPCIELSFFLRLSEDGAKKVLRAIYFSHPYEEPVIFITPCTRTRHIRGLDEENPNRFWNRDKEDWIPDEHR